MIKNAEETILTAIYETDKFKQIAKNFLEVKKIKNKEDIKTITNNFKFIVLNTINENLDNFLNEYGIKGLRKKIGNSTFKLKTRWYDNAIKKYLKEEVENANINFIKTGIVNKEFANVDILKQSRLTFLNNWKSDIRYNITDYPYLHKLTDKKIENAFKNDIILCITEELMTEYNFNIENILIKTPEPVAPSLFIPVKTGRRKEINTNDIKYKSDLLSIIESDEGDRTDYFYEIEKIDNEEEFFNLKLNNNYKLDQQDLDIIRYAYTYSYHDFNTFNTNDVLRFLGLSKNKYNQEKIENKFMKLPRYTFYAEKVSPDGNITSKTVFNLFSGVNITINEETGERIINTAKSNLFRLNPFSMEIMYKKELKKIKSEETKSIAYFLEGRRLYLISQGIDLKNNPQNITLREFRKFIKINLNKPKEAVTLVSKVLDEIINSQFILKSYEIKYYSFFINFYESDERKQLLLDKTIILPPEK